MTIYYYYHWSDKWIVFQCKDWRETEKNRNTFNIIRFSSMEKYLFPIMSYKLLCHLWIQNWQIGFLLFYPVWTVNKNHKTITFLLYPTHEIYSSLINFKIFKTHSTKCTRQSLNNSKKRLVHPTKILHENL